MTFRDRPVWPTIEGTMTSTLAALAECLVSSGELKGSSRKKSRDLSNNNGDIMVFQLDNYVVFLCFLNRDDVNDATNDHDGKQQTCPYGEFS